MRKFRIINSLVIIAGLVVAPASANAASLLEIYQQALQSDPQIHEAEARRLAALEAKPQARGGVLLPQVSASGGWDQTKSDGRQFSPLIGSGYSFDGDSDDADWNVTLRQTVFRWDQIVNLKRADKLVTKAEAVREAAQQDLVIRVAQRYFDVLAAEDRLTSIHADRTAIARQLEQAKQRFEVGLIAITDVQESQAMRLAPSASWPRRANSFARLRVNTSRSCQHQKKTCLCGDLRSRSASGSTCHSARISALSPVGSMRNWRATRFRFGAMVTIRRSTS
jgi:outer membrane protein TolC